jgi:hypothetical protein
MEDAKSSDLQQQMAQLEATLDALPVSQREVVMTRLRDAMLANGEQLSAEDDNVCRQFAEGAVSVRQDRWFDDYNESDPHKGLKMKSSREFARAQLVAGCPI